MKHAMQVIAEFARNRLALFLIILAAAVASFSASIGFALDQGADMVHVVAVPLALEALALVAIKHHRDHGGFYPLLIFAFAFVAAVAINVAYAAELPQMREVLMALYALPPVAFVAGGHLHMLGSGYRAQTAAQLDALTAEREAAHAEIEALRADLETLDAQNDDLAAQRDQLRGELRATTREYERETTTTTRERSRELHAQASLSLDDALAQLRADTRPVVDRFLAQGADLRDDDVLIALRDEVAREIGKSPRTAQERIRPLRELEPA